MSERFDFAVIGSGPGGQKAAVAAAKAGKSVVLIEQEALIGGACVLRGTIPSKALRESAMRARRLNEAAGGSGTQSPEPIELASLMGRVQEIVHDYSATVASQLARNGVECLHGRARFVSAHQLEVRRPSGSQSDIEADRIIIAAGSAPRTPPGIAIDHEHVLDSDSILSLAYLPRSLTVLGSGVIACEYASVFASLGVKVTIIDRGSRPIGFLDAELSAAFLRDFEAAGGSYLPERNVGLVAFDGVSQVGVDLEDGARIESDKVLVALGRTGCLAALELAAAGLVANDRGALEIDEHGRTQVDHIYAVGDVAGPPALATAAMEQGRRAARHALGLPDSHFAELLPTGIYTIPEMSSVGLTEEQAIELHGEVRVGRASFGEVARGHIAACGAGLLKLVADADTGRLLGVHIVGEGACELIHIGQMALFAGARVDDLIENVFNFPTLAEAYRIAALDLLNSRNEERVKPEPTRRD